MGDGHAAEGDRHERICNAVEQRVGRQHASRGREHGCWHTERRELRHRRLRPFEAEPRGDKRGAGQVRTKPVETLDIVGTKGAIFGRPVDREHCDLAARYRDQAEGLLAEAVFQLHSHKCVAVDHLLWKKGR